MYLFHFKWFQTKLYVLSILIYNYKPKKEEWKWSHQVNKMLWKCIQNIIFIINFFLKYMNKSRSVCNNKRSQIFSQTIEEMKYDLFKKICFKCKYVTLRLYDWCRGMSRHVYDLCFLIAHIIRLFLINKTRA